MTQPACFAPDDGKKLTIADRTYVQIRKAIVEGHIKAGSKISEPELAKEYGISRGPLREAIGRLEACGLVVREPHVGARVVSLSAEGLLEIYHVREALESMAARLAAKNMSKDEVAELRRLLIRHDEQISSDEQGAYFQREGDLDFHFRIIAGSHNNHLISLLCNDLYHLMRMYRFQYGMSSGRIRTERAFAEHEYIVDCIEAGDAELAELIMRRHIKASRENAERLLKEK